MDVFKEEVNEHQLQEPQLTPMAVRVCGEWLVKCLDLGWKHKDLDRLEALWLKHHNHRGELIMAVTERLD